MTDQLIRPRFRLGFLTHVQGRGDPAATYRNAQELFVVADELGFDVGWVAQHHAPLGGGGLPSPWTFLAHAAARTKRIRLSTAITVLPLENPVRLAEDVSVVDLLSGGRVEIGVGSGGSELEYAAFGRDVARKRELTSEGLQVLHNALANQEVGAPGFTIQPPAADFTGRIWQGVFRRAGAEYAAGGGSNLLLNRACGPGTSPGPRGSGCPGSSSRPRTPRPRSIRSAPTCTPPPSASRCGGRSRPGLASRRRCAGSTRSTAIPTRSSPHSARSGCCRSPPT